jgi:hypothetical protein
MKFSFAGAFSEGLAQHVRNQMLDRVGTPCQEVLGYSTETITLAISGATHYPSSFRVAAM